MERSIQLFAAVNFLIMGASHIAQPRVWAEFFVMLRARGQAGAMINGFLSLGMGSLIVAFHQVWSGIPLILTVLGYLYLLKAALIFVVPGYAVWTLRFVTVERAVGFRVVGVPLVGLGVLLLYVAVNG